MTSKQRHMHSRLSSRAPSSVSIWLLANLHQVHQVAASNKVFTFTFTAWLSVHSLTMHSHIFLQSHGTVLTCSSCPLGARVFVYLVHTDKLTGKLHSHPAGPRTTSTGSSTSTGLSSSQQATAVDSVASISIIGATQAVHTLRSHFTVSLIRS